MTHKSLVQTISVLIMISLLISSCKPQSDKEGSIDTGYYDELFRPQYHFSPASNWMNDPNGMVYFAGEYHLFYQHYPDSNIWGPMHWGHAISTDLVHWQHMPIALYPDSLGYIFSGSAVVDHQNTSGLGTLDQPALVAIFTYHDPEGERSGSNTFQNQGIAYSIDKGRTWMKYDGNPVLKSPGIRDFRDPKVIWHAETGKWIMILAVQDRVHLYSSPDLISWTFESEFGRDAGAHGGVWECPDLFQFRVDGTGSPKWVMLVSINPGGPNSGSATQYFVGNFDGHRFTSESTGNQWVDWGRDNYAGVTWYGIPENDDRRLFLGWMSNWQYANVVPTYAWRSAMTLPRELSLTKENGTYRLFSKPLQELALLREDGPVIIPPQTLSGEIEIPADSIRFNRCELIFDFRIDNPSLDSLGIQLENGQKERFFIVYNAKQGHIRVDRSMAGPSEFSKDFAGSALAPYLAGDHVQFKLFIDASSVELFVDEGRLVMTSLVFPSENFNKIKVFAAGGELRIENATLYNLKSIW